MGFERELYEFREPAASSSQITEMICILVRSGSVGTPLIVTAMWIPMSATRESFLVVRIVNVITVITVQLDWTTKSLLTISS